jgi:tetratricopeptide (TPR) repeat protein
MSTSAKTSLQQTAEWLQRGQAAEARRNLSEALSCYDQALALVRSAAVSDHASRRLLGIVWMNRGNALQQLEGAGSIVDAVAAYDEAIAVLQTLPFESDPVFRNHLGAAWLNRGHALLLASDASGVASFEQAISQLEKLPLDADPYFRLNLAGAWTNLAHATLASTPARARDAAVTALLTLSPVERSHEAFATMSLRARRALVMALGEQLRAAELSRSPTADLLSEATDAVDDGLSVAREFAQRASPAFRALAARLFRLGAQLYGRHQPHFLGEFLLEQVAAPAFANDPEFRMLAEAALAHALAEIQRPQLLVANTAGAAKAIETARAIRAAQQQLSQLPPLSPVPAPTSRT